MRRMDVREQRHVTAGAPHDGVIRAAIIEDQREIREGLAQLIDGTSGYRCTRTFRSMEDALAGIGAEPPDVALVDIGLPGMSGIEGIRILKERFPDVRLRKRNPNYNFLTPAGRGGSRGGVR